MHKMSIKLLLVSLVILSIFNVNNQSNDSEFDKIVLGIDLGTTYSCVGVYRNNQVEIIPNELGNRITPSVVAFLDDDERLIGEEAKNQMGINPKRTIYSIKRLIGRNYDDEEVQNEIKLLTYDVVDKENKPYVEVEINVKKIYYSPEEISSMILYKMRIIAENYLGVEIKDAIITVPANFNNSQRQATKDAGKIAGLNVLKIINEPTAASLAYGINKKNNNINILVFDLGGGTFDISLLLLDSDVFEVIGTNGDTHLGGEDFDNNIINYITDKFFREKNIDLTSNKNVMGRIKLEAEKAKRKLSSSYEVEIEIDDVKSGIDLKEKLTRAKFEQLNIHLYQKMMIILEETLQSAIMKKSDINEVILIGGSTRIPKISQMITDYFNGKTPLTSINPDEAVAHGAAIQGAILNGVINNGSIVLIDSTPLSLGIDTKGGIFTVIIPKGTSIPAERTQKFTTVEDYQEFVKIIIYEGERSKSTDNHPLGNFYLSGFKPTLRGDILIEVTFYVDANSILEVRAIEKKSNKSNGIIISYESDRLKPEQIEKMIRDSRKFHEKDKEYAEKIRAKDALDRYIYHIKKFLNDKDNKLLKYLTAKNKESINNTVNKAKIWLDTHPASQTLEYNKKLKELQDVCNPIMVKIYNQGNLGHQSNEEL